MTDYVLRNVIRWNGELVNECTNPNQARDKQRYLSNIRTCQMRLSDGRSTDARIRYDSSDLEPGN